MNAKRFIGFVAGTCALAGVMTVTTIYASDYASKASRASERGLSREDARFFSDSVRALKRGRNTFRHNTLGNESFWTDSLRLNEAIVGANLGGVGPGLDPETALAVGLKVDVRALPRSLRRALRRGEVDLTSPETTLALLKLNAVVGVRGSVNGNGNLESVGITCALCHSTVDDSFCARHRQTP